MRTFSWSRLVNLMSARSLYSFLQLRQGIHVPLITTKHLPQTDPPVWRVWCNSNDTCGLTCAILCWVFLLYADYVFMQEILRALALHLHGIHTTAGSNAHTTSYTIDLTVAAHAIIFNTFVILALISHTRCMLSDPGAIPHHTHPLPDNSAHHRSTICLSCSQSYKPPRAHHCSLCGRCIYKMDHHCPWINNCIGIANQKYFLLFLIYVFLAAIYCISITIYTSLQCKISLHQCYDPAYTEWYLTVQSMPVSAGRLPVSTSAPRVSLFPFLHLIITMMLCLLFGLFTITMFGGQMYAIMSDSPQIEQWQRERESYSRRAQTSLTRSLPDKNVYPIHSAQQALSAAAAKLQPVGEALVKDANVYNNPAASALYATYPLNTTDIASDSGAVEMNDLSSQQTPLIESTSSAAAATQSTAIDVPLTPLPPLYGLNNLILICTGKYEPTISGVYASAKILLDIILPTAPVFHEYARLCEYAFTPAPNTNNSENGVGLSDTSSNDGEWDERQYRHTNDRHRQERNFIGKQFSSYQENFRTV